MVPYLNKLEFPSPKGALCQVWFKRAQWFWKRRFLNFIDVFLVLPNYLPLVKGMAHQANKLESSSPKDTLCHVWLKLAEWYWRIQFLNFVNVCWLFNNYLPLEKICFVPSLVDSGEEDENVKRLQTDRWTDGWTDDSRMAIRKANKLAQMNFKGR